MKRPHLQKLSSDIVTPGHLISCPTLVIDITLVLFISLVFFSIVKFHVSKVLLSSDFQYGLLVAECVPIWPVVELFGRSVHLPKQDFLGTNRNAGNDFFVTQSRTHMSKTFIKHLQTYQLRKGRPNWTFCCRRQTSLRHLQSSPGCRATPTSNTRCWANIFTPADWKMLSVHGRDQYKDIQCILYMPMCQFMECIYTILK